MIRGFDSDAERFRKQQQRKKEQEQRLGGEDEEALPPPTDPIRVDKKPKRNAPCPCGSGKKYKQCCGAGS